MFGGFGRKKGVGMETLLRLDSSILRIGRNMDVGGDPIVVHM